MTPVTPLSSPPAGSPMSSARLTAKNVARNSNATADVDFHCTRPNISHVQKDSLETFKYSQSIEFPNLGTHAFIDPEIRAECFIGILRVEYISG